MNGGMVFLVILVCLFAIGVAMMYRADGKLRARCTQVVQGTIVRHEWSHSGDSSDGFAYAEYEFHGVWGQANMGVCKSEKEIQEKYPIGMRVYVRVNPDNPKECVPHEMYR